MKHLGPGAQGKNHTSALAERRETESSKMPGSAVRSCSIAELQLEQIMPPICQTKQSSRHLKFAICSVVAEANIHNDWYSFKLNRW